MTLAYAVADTLAGIALLMVAWRSSDHHTRRIWQWLGWLLGSIVFAIGAVDLTTAIGR